MKWILLALFASLNYGCTTLAPSAMPTAPLAQPTLFDLTVVDPPYMLTGTFKGSFRELKRERDRSLVEFTAEITGASGGAVSTITFVFHGLCGLMRARGKGFFVLDESLPRPSEVSLWVSFPKTPPAQNDPPKNGSAHECSRFQP